MKTFITGTVGAFLLLPIIGARAQAQLVNMRFKVEAVSFHAYNETGWDWTGSDEIYVAIHVPDGQIATYTKVFKDVDAGETKKIPPDQSCILPIAGVSGPTTLDASPSVTAGAGVHGDRWSCSNDGAPGPISFTVWLWEQDSCFICFEHGMHAPGEEPAPHDGSELIGRQAVERSIEQLTALQVGQVKEESITLSQCTPTPEERVKACTTEADYKFTWRLTRLPDAEPVVSPVTRLREPKPRE